MLTPAVEEFAKALTEEVRDRAIDSADALLTPQASSPQARRWKALGIADDAIKTLIPDIVDEAVFALLHAIDGGALRLQFVGEDGSPVDLGAVGEGEFGGWYMGSGGWRQQYSNARFHDDFADLVNG